MKTNYAQMENDELNRLAAEMMGTTKNEFGREWLILDDVEFLLGLNEDLNHEWNPTDPESNQAERYLFPKLFKKKCAITIRYKTYSYRQNKVIIYLPIEGGIKLGKSTENNDDINRAKVIACLEAWEKIND